MAYIPSPSVNGFHLGPLFIHYYGLMYVIGITLAILITQRRWKAAGGDPALVGDVALWAVPAGIIGGRIYFDITTPKYIPHHWYGIFAVWDGGLGIWGGIALGAAAGIWRVRRSGANWAVFADAVAPALLVAQAIGRIGNYFNKELFGGPTSLPWGLYIPPADRPRGYFGFTTFQPTFLYELIFDLALAAALVWLGHHRKIRPPGLFALYVTGYSAFRIFEESLRVDPSEHIFGLRLNMYVAIILALAGATWFWRSQQRGEPEPAVGIVQDDGQPQATAPDEATAEATTTEDTTGTQDAAAGETGAEDTAPEVTAEATPPAGGVPAEVGADRSGGTAETGTPADAAEHSD